MANVSDLFEYFSDLVKQGRGDYPVCLGTRGMESLRPCGRIMRIERPHIGEEHNGFVVFLRADDMMNDGDL